jgi:peptidase C25-like protein/flagellar hook capping protein FlgD
VDSNKKNDLERYMKKTIALFLIIVPYLISGLTLNIEEPVTDRSGFINDLPVMLDAGKPSLPFIPIKILVPMGERISDIQIELIGDQKTIKNVYIEPASAQQPISGAFSVPNKIDQAVYSTNELFPSYFYKDLGIQRMKGYDILLLNLYPYQYNPVQQEIIWNDQVSVEFSSRFDEETFNRQNELLLESSEVRERIEAMVLNGEISSTYRKSASLRSRNLADINDPYNMIIVTDAERAPFFTEFIEWKNAQGVLTGLFLTSDIYNNYTGEDEQAQIREFILDAYAVYSATDHPLEFVLLGGDDEIVPIRKVYGQVGGTIDYNLPCDLYYSNLDGDWDGNGNGIYGENYDDVDMLSELAVGRIPAEEDFEFENVFQKNYHYVDNPSVSDDMAYMLGENLNNNPLTWGGDYKDEVSPLIDDGIHIFTLYEREGTFGSDEVHDAIDFGVSIINHMGHSNEVMVFGQGSDDAHSYINTEYGFAYSQGCYPAAFDEMTSGSGESVAENLVIATGGLYAFVGNTRYGWYAPGSTNGASQFYDITFFEGIYNEDLRELGNALQYSREQLVNEALTSGVMRWVYYEMVVFGDPSVRVKETNGNFPFLHPLESNFDDFQGDSDGVANPGETINLYVVLENMEGWADAEGVYATIEFEDDTIEVIEDYVYYGAISSGSSSGSSSFVVTVPQDCNYDVYEYTVDVYSTDGEDVLFHKSYDLGFEVSLFQKEWPWSSSISFVANPMIYDFNEDGERDILTQDILTNVHLLNSSAEEQEGYPWEFDEDIWRSSALGDINEDGSADLVVACKTGKIYAVTNSGELIFEFTDCMQQILTPIITDLNGDNIPEIVSFGIDNKVLVLDNTGSLLPGFPLELPMLSVAEMASADLDENGENEILIGTQDGFLHAYTYNAEELDNFPVDLGSPVCAAPVILDNKNIVTGTCNNNVHIVSPTGEVLVSSSITSRIASSAILGNFDTDDDLELAFNTVLGDIYILDQDGTELAGWPVSTGKQFVNPPLAADIDNDQEVDLLCLSVDNVFYAYNSHGEEFPFSPVPVNMSGTTPASIDDVDADLDYEIVAGASRGVYMLDIKLRKGSDIPWRTYRGNYLRTGYYGDNEVLDSDETTTPPVLTELYQNYPNPFNPVTNIAFSLESDITKAQINIFNIRGQKVRSIRYTPQSKQDVHSVIWDGTSDLGRNVSSGIYFYQLEANGSYISSKKCLLIK